MSMFRKIYPFVLLIAFAALAGGCGGDEPVQAKAARQQGPVPVEVATVAARPFQATLELPGRVSARRVAEVRARVAGIILSRDFKEGSDVKKGQVLFHIDPAPFQASLAQARATLAQAEANMIDLKATAERYEKLIATKSISQQEYDTAVNSYKAAEANKRAAEAAVRTASLNLGYATVTAPISGRIGRAFVTEGALVGEGEATSLATIQQLDPIYADINQPVSEYLKLKAAMNKAGAAEQEPEVTVTLDDVDYTATGRLLFSDVTVDQDTNQVSLRSEFPNTDGMLLPGLFVRIRVPLGKGENAVFVPQRAVQVNVDGSATVFVVDAESKAQPRPVKTGAMQGSEWRILEGLVPGDRVVVGGLAKVKPGAAVAVQNPGATSGAAGANNAG